MDEGLGKYAEACAVDDQANHRAVAEFLRKGELIHIRDMLTISIGSHEKTGIAYRAAGSFVDYLIKCYSLEKLKEAFVMERRTETEKADHDTWISVYGKPLDELEKEWIGMIAERHDIGEDKVEAFLNSEKSL